MTQKSSQPGKQELPIDEFHPGLGIIAWPKETVSAETGKSSFTAAVVMKKASPDAETVIALYKLAVKTHLGGKAPATSPIKDGDAKDIDGQYIRPEEQFRDAIFFNVKTQFAPKVSTRDGTPMSFSDIKSGDKCGLMFNIYNWNFQGKKGVSFGLGQMIFVAPGKAIGGSGNAEAKLDELLKRSDLDSDGFSI